MTTAKQYMVFDVESVGLHGEGFAVAWQVVDSTGKRIASAGYACNPDLAEGKDDDRKWVAENCHFALTSTNCPSPRAVRREFWDAWMYGKKLGAVLVADCCWPVEARFLMQCIADDPDARNWEGPYPLHDIASMLLMAERDPLETRERLEGEFPAHDPLADARQSARILLECLGKLEADVASNEPQSLDQLVSTPKKGWFKGILRSVGGGQILDMDFLEWCPAEVFMNSATKRLNARVAWNSGDFSDALNRFKGQWKDV